jgi:hypothetical protein
MTTIAGGKATAYNGICTEPVVVVPKNPTRTSLTFANPGTETLYVGPLDSAEGKPLGQSIFALGGTIPLGPGAVLVITGECHGAFLAFAVEGEANPLTVMESNI